MLEELQMFLEVCISSLPLGAIYCLLALSFVLIYRATKIFNLCQGEIMMFGAYCAYTAIKMKVPFVLAILISLLVTCALAYFLEKFVVRRFMAKPIFVSIMVTVGLGILLRGVIGLAWGVDQKILLIPYFESMPDLPGIHMNYGKIFIVFMAILAIGILSLYYKHSKSGLASQATVDDLTGAMYMGVDVRQIFSQAWLLAAVISVFTGVFLARLTILQPGISSFSFIALSALVLGGIDSIGGAIVGGFCIGLAEGLSVFYIGGQSKQLAGFIVMFLVLMFRPYGLFGRRKIERV